MKVMKYSLGFILIIGLGISAWLYYPQYQIQQIKKQATEVNTDVSKISFINYFHYDRAAQIKHLAIGDSVIRGVGASRNEDLVYQFSNKLAKQIRKNVQFDNEGISGITSSELMKMMDAGRFDKKIKQADIVTINVGGNDLLRISKNGDFYNIFKTFDQVQSTFSKNLANITATIKKLNPKVTIVFLELYNPLPPDNQFYSLADKLLPNWNLKIYQVAHQYPSSVVVQTTKVINGERLKNLSPDGVHPNSAGYTAISEQMIYQFKHQYRKETV